MATDVELAYCAGLIDGEGCIRIKRSQPYRHLTGRVNPGYSVAIHLRMVDEPAIAFLHATLGGWYYAEKAHSTKGRPLFCWQATDQVAESVLRAVRPYLRIKAQQADLALEFRALQADRKRHRTKITGYRNFPNSHGTPRQVPNLAYSDEYIAACDAIYDRSRALNRVGVG
jgi:hypothetical protein